MSRTSQFWRFTRLFVLELWPWYLGGTFFLALTNVITLEIPQFAKDIVNAMQDQIDAVEQERLPSLALGIVLLGLGQILVRSLSRILIFWPGRKLEARSKSYLFQRVLQLPQTFFDRFGMGDLISRFSNDLGQLRVFFAFGILQILNLVFIAIFTLYNMLQVHTALTLASLTPILLMIVAARVVMPRLQRFTRKNQEAIGSLTNRVTESLTNIHIVQANAAERSFYRLIAEENQKVYETDMKVLVLRTLFFPLMTSLTGLSQLVVLFFGGTLIMQSQLSIGDILAFNFYLSYLAFPLTSIGIVLAIYQRSKTALERLQVIFDEPVEASPALPPSSGPATVSDRPWLSIRQLNFNFPGQERLVLKDLNLDLMRGDMIGLCGPVGSGKSTLFHLLTRIYDPPRGTISLAGQDILDIPPDRLRLLVAYALQRVHLFSSSIRDNLSFGLHPKPSQRELDQAATSAQMASEILSFPQAWETEIGEKGLRLSGGQKQRLALARVFLRDAQLLLLDDVLSAVDNLTEARLIQELRRRGTTMLIASHRSSVLELCDRVILLEDGIMRDQGRFAELITRHPELQEEEADVHAPQENG